MCGSLVVVVEAKTSPKPNSHSRWDLGKQSPRSSPTAKGSPAAQLPGPSSQMEYVIGRISRSDLEKKLRIFGVLRTGWEVLLSDPHHTLHGALSDVRWIPTEKHPLTACLVCGF